MSRINRKKGNTMRLVDMGWDSLDLERDLCPIEASAGNKEEGSKGVKKLKLGFQVAEVRKPLIAVKRITEQGNHVNFGPGKDDNFIENREAGSRIPLRPNGKGSYLMGVTFEGGGKTSITVDSGAEESVCPWEWGQQFPVKDPARWLDFKNASGGNIAHWGGREVVVTSSF